jgi:hypothetical protein
VKESTPQPDATIPAPTGALADQPCPICKEKFHSEWDEEKEDWVWKNAIKVGEKVYHASCFTETRGKLGIIGDRSKTASRSGTPQPSESLGSILGKRKGISNNPEALKVPRLTEWLFQTFAWHGKISIMGGAGLKISWAKRASIGFGIWKVCLSERGSSSVEKQLPQNTSYFFLQ